jgi:hypothetical protein
VQPHNQGMGLFKKVFGDKGLASAGRQPPVSEFPDSEAAPVNTSWRSLVRSRREAIHVVLRECMRQHAIPADWIDARLLVDTEDSRLASFTILLLVRDGHASLQGYAPTFQSSFADALQRFDPRSPEWLATICWSFGGSPRSAVAPEAPQMAAPAFVAAGAGLAAGTSLPAGSSPEPDSRELDEDLQALFAIRDAVLRGQAPPDPQRPE